MIAPGESRRTLPLGLAFIRGAAPSHVIVAAASALLIAPECLAIASAPERPETVQGIWGGRYVCDQSGSDVALSISDDDDDLEHAQARSRFYGIAESPNAPSAEYEFGGGFDPVFGHVDLHPSKWLSKQPGYRMMGLEGPLELGGQSLKDAIDATCCGAFAPARAGVGTAYAELVQTQPSAPEQTPSIQAGSKEELEAITLQAIHLFQAGRYDEALPIAERALALAERLYGPDHVNVVANLTLVVLVLRKAERFAEAVPFAQRILAIDEKKLGPDHPTVANDLRTLAQLLWDLYRFCEEEPFLRRALAIDEKNLGPGDPTAAIDRTYLENSIHACKPPITDTDRPRIALTGQLTIVLEWAVPLAFAFSFLLLWIYLRAVKRSMRRHGGVGTPDSTPATMETTVATKAPPLPLDIVTTGEDAAQSSESLRIERRALVGPRRTAAVYVFAGLGYAVTLAALYLRASGFEFSPLRFLFLTFSYAWPVVLTVGLVAAISWRGWLSTVAVYLCLFAAVSLSAVELAPSHNITWDQVISSWFWRNCIGTILILAFLPRQIRAVGPMVLVFMIAAVGGSTVWRNVLGASFGPRSRQVVEFLLSLGLEPLYTMEFIGVLVLGLIGWVLLRGLGRLYSLRWISDQSIIVDSIWLLFAISYAIDFAFFSPSWFLAPFAAFAIYKIVALLGFASLRQDSTGTDPKLLLLRVFSLGRRSALLFDAFGKLWRYAGSIRLIAGPDLATSTVEPHEFLDFLSGKLSRRFISGQETLARRLAETEPRRDFDDRYRVGEFFCFDDSWRTVLGRLAYDSNTVMMDLRGFSPQNKGCIFEINALLNAVPLTRVVFVTDETTDQAFLRETFAQGWAALGTDSPNRELREPRVHLFQFTGTNDGSVPSLVRVVARAAKDETASSWSRSVMQPV